MNIKLKACPGRDWETIEIDENARLDEMASAAEASGDAPYRILLARVNGRDAELSETVREGDRVELLDMRTHAANMVYQRILTMIYLTAARDVFDAMGLTGVRVEIDNSINKGFYTTISISGADGSSEISRETASAIENRMLQLVHENVPIEKQELTPREAIETWMDCGYPEKAEIFSGITDEKRTEVCYSMNGYRNYFYGPMVPSAGYIEYFRLTRYRDGLLLQFPYYDTPEVMPETVDQVKLYEAFEEEHRWLQLLDAATVADMNKIIARGQTKETILLSEALHEKKIAEIAAEIKEKGKRIILIAGPSSSGKTTFAKRLCIQLRVAGLKPLYLGTDDYFVERAETPLDANGEKNYEDLEALDINLFSNNMNGLLRGEEVDIPEFDFLEGRKIFGRRVTRIDRDQPIVIEGIHALNDSLTTQIDEGEKYRIYISPLTQLNIDAHNRVPTTDARMLRRMVRDCKYRNHPPADTIRDWPKVRAGENRNIFPYNTRADVIFNSNLAYETFLLRKYAEPLLLEICPDQPEYSEARRLLEMLRFFSVIEDEKDVPNNSIIREFIGGSVFVE